MGIYKYFKTKPSLPTKPELSSQSSEARLASDASVVTTVTGGELAAGEPDTTNPIKVGGVANASQQTAVSDGDLVDISCNLNGEIVKASYDWASGKTGTLESDPISAHHTSDTIVDETNITDGTYEYYVDMDNYRKSGYHLELSGGSGTITVTFEGTMQDDGTVAASCDYQDVTTDTFGAASYTADDMLVDNAEKLAVFKYVKVKVVASTTGANDADVTIYHKRLY